jgi:hypothetical protein
MVKHNVATLSAALEKMPVAEEGGTSHRLTGLIGVAALAV